jgi:hypothetical protein
MFMSIDTVLVEEVLEKLALQEEYRFNAYQISALSGQEDADTVNLYLLSKAQFGVLRVKVETLCPENHPDQQFEFNRDIINSLIEEVVTCRICDTEYTPSPDFCHLVYYFEPKFIESIKKKETILKEKIAM